MGPQDASTPPPPEVADPELDEPERRTGAGTTRWAVFVALTIVAVSYSAYSMAALGYTTLTSDTGAQFYLAKITSEGAVPLVDFQHGWNTGSWWASAVLYRIAGGDPTVWSFLWGRLLGVGLAAVLVAGVGLRLRLAPSAMVSMALGVLILVPPAHMKYALPVLWVFVLLPSHWLDGGRGRGRLVVGFLTPFVLFWVHVELAILLTAGTVLFELVGRREAPWLSRLLRSAALGAGLVMGFVTEALFYRLGYGMSIAEFNRQVVFGQAQEFPKHFGWPFFDVPTNADNYMVVALFPVAVLLPFVPAIWRRLTDPTRFVALSALCLATIAIRRPGPGHSTTVGALVLVALILVVCDLELRRPEVAGSGRTRPRLLTVVVGVVGALVGIAWAVLALKVGFDTDSLAGPVVLIVLALVAVVATRFFAPYLFVASLGALLVIAVYPVVAAVDRVNDMAREDEPLAMAEQMATAIKPELERCLGGSNEALIVPTVLPLYDALGVENPTPFYLFHYDFGRNEETVEADFESGRVPVVIAALGLPKHPWMNESLRENYRRCSRVKIEEHRETVDIWTHKTREPFEKRVVTVKPDGETTYKRR